MFLPKNTKPTSSTQKTEKPEPQSTAQELYPEPPSWIEEAQQARNKPAFVADKEAMEILASQIMRDAMKDYLANKSTKNGVLAQDVEMLAAVSVDAAKQLFIKLRKL